MNSMRDLKRKGEILSAFAQTERDDFIRHSNRIVELVSFTKKEIVQRYLLRRNPVLIFTAGLLLVVSPVKISRWLSYGFRAWRLVGIIKKN